MEGAVKIFVHVIKESLGMHEWKQHKPFFDEEYLGFFDQRKRAKMHWVQDPCESDVDNLNSVRREVRHFRNKKKEYLRAEIEELEANSKIQNIRDLCRGINDFKKWYQPRCNIVKDEKSDLFADPHSIVVRWRNYFSQLFNVHGVKDVGQVEIHTAGPLVPEPGAFEFELAIGKLKSHKSPGFDEIPSELIKAGSGIICGEIHKLITSISKKEKLPEEWRVSITVPIHKKGDKTDCNNYRGISLLINTKFYPTSCSQV